MMIDRLRRTAKLAILHLIHLIDESHRRRINGGDHTAILQYWNASRNTEEHLVIGGCDTVELAREFGTPLHVVDSTLLLRTYHAFRDAFLRHYPHIDVSYSYKTNPLPGVLAALHSAGASAEVISHFELWLALRLGVAADRIIFNGPGKTVDALALAVSNGIRLINIDNTDEPRTIDQLAAAKRYRQPVGLRVVPSVGWSGQFGLNIASGAAFSAFRTMRQLEHLHPCGIHVHLGTGIKSLDIYKTAIREALQFAKSVERELDIEMEYLDFGGGFGVPTVKPYSVNDMRLMLNGYPATVLNPDAHPSLDTYAQAVSDLVNTYYPASAPRRPRIILEPGRAITSSAQTLLLRVLTVKDPGSGKKTIITDGGKNIALPTGYEYHHVLPASKADGAATQIYDIFGPLCHPGDVLFNAIALPDIRAGDLLAIMDAGAYFVPNQTNFSNPRPAAVVVRDGSAEIIRRRETFEHIVGLDCWD